MNVDKICEEIIWYSEKKNGKFVIPIVIDFDFTLTCKSSWLDGTFEENPHAFNVVKRWINEFNVGFILETMRGEKHIQPALDFLKENGIILYGVGRNPIQDQGEDLSCKIWGVFSVDDRDACIPLICPDEDRPYVDWEALDKIMTPIIKQVHDRIPELENEVLEKKKKAYE